MFALILIFLCCNFYSFCSSEKIDNLIKTFEQNQISESADFGELLSKFIRENKGWSKDNIHLLLLLLPDAGDYQEVLENNIELLIKEFTEKIDIRSSFNLGYTFNKVLSEKIIAYIGENKGWSKDNIHLLWFLDSNVKFIEQINALIEVKKKCRFWHILEKYNIQNKINLLLVKNDYPFNEDNLKDYSNSTLENLRNGNFSNLDISYVGMCPFGKLIVASGIVASGVNTVLFKKNMISNPLSYIVWGLASAMVVVPPIINQRNRFKDEKKYFPQRQKVFNNLLGILNTSMNLSDKEEVLGI